MKELYGENRVAQIGTKLTLAMKSVCRDTGKALGHSLEEVAVFSSGITKDHENLADAFEKSERIQEQANKYPEWWSAMLALEGHQRGVGVHAGGVVLSPEPIDTILPLRVNEKGLLTSQYDMKWIEKFLVKFDILKLETLRLIKMTMQLAGIEKDVDLDELDMDDPYVYKQVFGRQQLSGVFQVESEGMKDTIALIQPDNFGDLSALIALYRPGPMDFIPTYAARKHGREPIVYQFDSCKEILEETYGVLVYQEQAMQMSVALGGLSKGQSDYVRHGIAKKKIPEIEEWVGNMIYGNAELNIPGALSKGHNEQELLKLKEEWIKFGSYCFNKSHSVAYAKISFQTAYLKTYYYIYFMAALISTSESKKTDNKEPKHIRYQKELRQNGIRIYQPDILLSKDYWTPILYDQPIVEKDGITYCGEIRFSLTSIAGVTKKTMESLSLLNWNYIHSFKTFLTEIDSQKEIRSEVKTRLKLLLEDLEVLKADDSGMNMTTLIDLKNDEIEFCENELKTLGKLDIDKGAIQNFIKAGALDRYTPNRNLMLKEFALHRGDVEEAATYPDVTTKVDCMLFEKEALGCVASVETKWDKVEDGQKKQFTGHVTKIEDWIAGKSGKKHFYVTVDIGGEEIQCTLWGFKMDRLKGQLEVGNKVTVKGEKGFNRLTLDSIIIK